MHNQQMEDNKRHYEMFGKSFTIKYDADVIAAIFFNHSAVTIYNSYCHRQ